MYEIMENKWKPWLVCFAATFLFFYAFIQDNMFASIAADIMQDFDIQAGKMAYLSSVYYISNVLFLFLAGYALDRFSIKYLLMAIMVLCALSSFVLASTHSFQVAFICRFLMGIGSAFCFLGPVRLASQWFPPKKMALVTGAIVTMAMSGGMLAQYPLTVLVNNVGFRTALQYIGWLGIIMFFFMGWLIQEKSHKEDSNHPKISFLEAAKKAYFNLQNIRVAMYTSLLNMAIAIFGALMGTLYLQQRLGVDDEAGSLINSFLFLGAMVGGPLMGYISDKIGLRILPMRIGALLSLAVLICILYAPVSYYTMMGLFFLLGLFTSAQVISYAFVAETTPHEMIAMAISVISILTRGGYILYQNLFSALLIREGSMQIVNDVPIYGLQAYQYAAIILPMGLIIALILLIGLKETHKKPIQVM